MEQVEHNWKRVKLVFVPGIQNGRSSLKPRQHKKRAEIR
jgi:hypothetical protein